MEVVMGLRRNPNASPAHVRRLVQPVAAALAVAAAVLAVAPAAPARAITMTTAERQVLALVNHARTSRGLHRLTIVQSLERAARSHSRQMVNRNYFSHSSFSGESFSARLIRFGYSQAGCTSWTVGEDIAYGTGSAGSPKAIYRAWMHSPAHRAIILTAKFRNAGVGRAKGTFRGIPGVVFFTLDCGARTR
jgi:uncharacterized protein YkwD